MPMPPGPRATSPSRTRRRRPGGPPSGGPSGAGSLQRDDAVGRQLIGWYVAADGTGGRSLRQRAGEIGDQLALPVGKLFGIVCQR